ncbi:hypothetical protein GCU67_17710 [Modestobacter muralis]|uniref:Uncharacterized protein n=1 Tax=Modestobacter muralis TaxID=1608614 RepID=A0A6P0EYI1_9ACTN|nr:hypothetical protein [Modestobacter muralis]NEK95983.1 hypothetical protein [Modestobacter muralis]NEN52871.1 hypothetical protein [Modestobacter muralis]
MTSTAPDPAGVDPEPTRSSPELSSPDVPARPPWVRSGRLHLADVLVAAGTVLFALLLLAPWFRTEARDLGFGHRVEAATADGLDSGLLVTALVLLVLASCWGLLPAVADVRPPFPRELVTAGLTALALLLTLLEWLTTLDIGLSVPGLLAVLTAAVVFAVAVRALVPQARAWVAAERPPNVT